MKVMSHNLTVSWLMDTTIKRLSISVVILITILCFSIYVVTDSANPSKFGPPQEDIIVYFLPQGAIMAYLNVTELAQRAETIIIGDVTEILPSQEDPETGFIYTDVVLDVETCMKISLNQSTILVRTLGGTVGNLGMWTEDETSFTEGERVLLFLGRIELYGNALHVIGGHQGKYILQNGMATNKDHSRNTTLEELLEEIQQAV